MAGAREQSELTEVVRTPQSLVGGLDVGAGGVSMNSNESSEAVADAGFDIVAARKVSAVLYNGKRFCNK